MKNRTKYLVIGTALLTAAAGSAAAFAGQDNCNRGEGGMFGKGHFGQMQGNMQGNMNGNIPGHGYMQGGRHGHGPMGYMQGIYQLDNLTDEQKAQLNDLRESQQALMRAKRAEMSAQRADMKARIDAILTDEQRQALADMNS